MTSLHVCWTITTMNHCSNNNRSSRLSNSSRFNHQHSLSIDQYHLHLHLDLNKRPRNRFMPQFVIKLLTLLA